MAALTPRPYQSRLIAGARGAFVEGDRAIILVAPTGSGKGTIAAILAARAAAKGKRIWLIAHRIELVRQLSADLTVMGVQHSIVAAGEPFNPDAQVQVCSMQTLARRLGKLPPPDLCYIDEVHHVVCDTYSLICAAIPNAYRIGFTATPIRTDGRGLKKWFDRLIVGPSMRELIDGRYLCDYVLYAPPPPDLTGVHTIAGEYDRGELAAAMDKPKLVGDAVAHYKRLALGTRAIVFGVSVVHSKHLAEQFCQAGIDAQHVDGETPREDREKWLREFNEGRFPVITNVGLFGEGVNSPGVNTVICARPTKSLTVWLQQVGRAMRPKPDGSKAIIIDHAGNSRRHGLPDEDRGWELTDDRIKLRSPDEVPITTCPGCFMVVPAATEICPDCGAMLTDDEDRDDKGAGKGVGRGLKHEEGELVAVDTLAARRSRDYERQQAQTLEELRELALARGYRPGWAYHVWKARGGNKRYG
jgi:DNA repair protein RadD